MCAALRIERHPEAAGGGAGDRGGGVGLQPAVEIDLVAADLEVLPCDAHRFTRLGVGGRHLQNVRHIERRVPLIEGDRQHLERVGRISGPSAPGFPVEPGPPGTPSNRPARHGRRRTSRGRRILRDRRARRCRGYPPDDRRRRRRQVMSMLGGRSASTPMLASDVSSVMRPPCPPVPPGPPRPHDRRFHRCRPAHLAAASRSASRRAIPALRCRRRRRLPGPPGAVLPMESIGGRLSLHRRCTSSGSSRRRRVAAAVARRRRILIAVSASAPLAPSKRRLPRGADSASN